MIYLACPYSHPDPEVRHARFVAVSRAAAKIMAQGLWVFSPISHSHPIACESIFVEQLDVSWESWKDYDLAMMENCDELRALMLPGWKRSKGLRKEFNEAAKLEMKIRTLPLEFVPEFRELKLK